MKKVAFIVALVVGLQTSAEPFDPNNPKLKSAKISGTLTAAVIDAGVLNVQGQETVAGPIVGMSTIAGNTITSNTGAFRLVDSNTNAGLFSGTTAGFTANSAVMRGDVANSAANSAVSFTNVTALTSGFDRYNAQWSNGTSVTARVFTNGAFQALYTAGTAGVGTGITANVTSAVVPFVHKVTVINTAMTAAATTDLTIWTTPVNARLNRIVAEVTQVFTGGALSAVTVQCGNTAGGTQYLLANSVFTAQNTWGDVAAEIGAGLLSATVADMGTPAAGIPGAIVISCRFTCTGANCNAATQGSVTFEIEGVVYP